MYEQLTVVEKSQLKVVGNSDELEQCKRGMQLKNWNLKDEFILVPKEDI